MSLDLLPGEVVQHILYYLPPLDILSNIQRLSKRFSRLADEPLLWRHHCYIQFKYWDPKHRIRQKFVGNVGDVDWKRLYIYRQKTDLQTTRILNSILAGQIDRIEKFEMIAGFGYDAKDTLLRHCHTADIAEDVLARRYYANAVLDHVHRSKALEEWWELGKGENVPLERALGSFDLFVLHDQRGDLLEISDLFDELIARLRLECPNLEQMSIRGKALAAVSFLRAHNLTGIATEAAYRDLQNNYIGIALQDEDHPSLPLISVAIFCALGKRLGLDARCCGMPNHVHAMVYPNAGETLDGGEIKQGDSSMDPMYLDPYRSDCEIPIEHLRSMLAAWGVQPVDFARFLRDSTTGSLVLRTSRNILATVHEFRGHGGRLDNIDHPTIRLHANPYADMDNAFYSALWANFMLSNLVTRADGSPPRQFLPLIQERFERHYPMDASLIERYVCPPFGSSTHAGYWELYEALRVVRAADSTPRQLRLRNTAGVQDRVKYTVGQVFRHKRYGYQAVITGWDIECGVNSEWMAHDEVDALSRGRHQSFYHTLTCSVEDTSIRYVAEENIEIIEPEMPTSLMCLAGRYFKRWDRDHHRFVSNIRDEYPED